MDFHIGQPSHPGICQAVAVLFLRISSLDAGASIVLFLLDIASSWDGAYQPVVSLGVKVKGSPRACGVKEALAPAQRRRTAELKPASLLILAPVDHLETANARVGAIITKVEGAVTDSINPPPRV